MSDRELRDLDAGVHRRVMGKACEVQPGRLPELLAAYDRGAS